MASQRFHNPLYRQQSQRKLSLPTLPAVPAVPAVPEQVEKEVQLFQRKMHEDIRQRHELKVLPALTCHPAHLEPCAQAFEEGLSELLPGSVHTAAPEPAPNATQQHRASVPSHAEPWVEDVRASWHRLVQASSSGSGAENFSRLLFKRLFELDDAIKARHAASFRL